jgi:hypothetical protein
MENSTVGKADPGAEKLMEKPGSDQMKLNRSKNRAENAANAASKQVRGGFLQLRRRRRSK